MQYNNGFLSKWETPFYAPTVLCNGQWGEAPLMKPFYLFASLFFIIAKSGLYCNPLQRSGEVATCPSNFVLPSQDL